MVTVVDLPLLSAAPLTPSVGQTKRRRDDKMQSEVITRRDDLMIRRLVLELGEAMPWHTDACHRFSVIVRGQQLTLEFRETGEQIEVAVCPGMVDWDQPDARVHRAVNTGATTYEEVVTFLLSAPGLEPQLVYP